MADEDKLDKVLTHLDSLHTKMDCMGTRMDAMETEHKKDRADAAEWQARADAWRKDSEEKGKADKARKDAEEKEKADKMRADAEAKEKEEKEKEEKERADKVRKDAEEKEKADAAAANANTDLAKKLAEMERHMPAILSEEDRLKFSDVQMRADEAYQAWGYGRAPGALQGETLNDYRIRLLSKIKPHSKLYKDSNLGALVVADSAAFSVVEGTIINDAVDASSSQVTVGGPLREQSTRSPSGHLVTKFFGDPAVTWAPFMGGATKFGRINRDMANRR